jgi:NTE family protein
VPRVERLRSTDTLPRVSATEPLLADLVFEGGGVKGIALAGAYRELSDRGYEPQCVAGTSAGAITAALVAVGYTGAEVEQIVLRDMHFPDFEDPAFLDHFGKVGDVAEFFIHRGMHSGDYFLSWIRKLLAAKGKTTFGELRNPPGSATNRQYRLQVVVSDLTARAMLVLPRDADQLGIESPDDLEIAEAVRMSMSIPVFFAPVIFRDGRNGVDHVIVDGGLLSNYPIWLFDTPGSTPPDFPTFGMTLVAPGQQTQLAANPPADAALPDLSSDLKFLKAIVSTMLQGRDRFYIDADSFARTIPIPTLGVGTTDFGIQPAEAQALFDSGKAAAAKFLASWDFEAYKKLFRT